MFPAFLDARVRHFQKLLDFTSADALPERIAFEDAQATARESLALLAFRPPSGRVAKRDLAFSNPGSPTATPS
jgi:hypothetical protein